MLKYQVGNNDVLKLLGLHLNRDSEFNRIYIGLQKRSIWAIVTHPDVWQQCSTGTPF